MDELILRVLAGEASPFEEGRLRRWRLEDPGHEAHYRELEELWNLSEPELPAAPPTQAVEALQTRILREAAERRGDLPLPLYRRPTLRRFALAGSTLAAGLAAITLFTGNGADPAAGPQGTPTASVSSPAPQTLRLDDGSYVRLAAGSRIEVEFQDAQRRVLLTGRAFFAVAPEADRPFVVQTEGAEVRVLGTRFEVAQDRGETRTVVVEGLVSLSSGTAAVQVPAGSVGEAPRSGPPSARAVDDPWALLDWPGGLLVFHETPLENVAHEVERHFGASIRIDDPGAARRRISASFQEEESFLEVLETLCAVTAASCRITPDSAVIASNTGEGT